MPSKNSVKTYVENGIYHVYNRGVEKRAIFQDDQDYKVFLRYLKECLSPPANPKDLKIPFTLQGASFKGIPRLPKNYSERIQLIAFCLMPNHFHLLIKQITNADMEGFMRSIATRYSMYFNKKYNRVGKLFQGHYKAALVTNDHYLLHLSRYIHLNPAEYTKNLEKAYSSYTDYILCQTKWVKPEIVLAFFNSGKIPEFKKINSYKSFVEGYKQNSRVILGDLTLESEED